MELRPGLSLDEGFLAAFASVHGIRRLALYGSALGDGFGPDSDIDILVEFRPEHTPGLLHLAHAKSISPDGRAAIPDVPWRAAARMRDRLVHHYFDINLDVLWQTITEDLPRMLAALPSEDDLDRREDRP